jgi:hypothetical protein
VAARFGNIAFMTLSSIHLLLLMICDLRFARGGFKREDHSKGVG